MSGSSKDVSDYSVIIESHFDDNKKVVTVSSTALVRNMTDHNIAMKILHPKKEVDLLLENGETKPIPFDYVTSRFNL